MTGAFWAPLERQVRVVGLAERVAHEEAEAYFATRPRGSQLGAWVSDQSSVIAADELQADFKAIVSQFEAEPVPCPPHWGGYRVRPTAYEFWQGRSDRLHDRIQFTLEIGGAWRRDRLAP